MGAGVMGAGVTGVGGAGVTAGVTIGVTTGVTTGVAGVGAGFVAGVVDGAPVTAGGTWQPVMPIAVMAGIKKANRMTEHTHRGYGFRPAP